jgi:predicted DNA binding CopG/RHH family protein
MIQFKCLGFDLAKVKKNQCAQKVSNLKQSDFFQNCIVFQYLKKKILISIREIIIGS